MRTGLAWALVTLVGVALVADAFENGKTRLASGLAIPDEVAFRSDGVLLVAALNTGDVRSLADEGAPWSLVAHVAASPGGNGGFTGLATDPADAHALYVVYSVDKPSAPHGKVNRVSKLVDGTETVLLDDIPWADFHTGGRIALGPDGFLYVTTGDNGGPTGEDYTRKPGDYPGDPVQDPMSRIGKVLRLAKDGTAAGGVPGWDPYVYAMGFRNPFGLAFGPDGTLYASENGITHDEIDIIVRGADYGWPACEGACAGYQKPLTTFDDSFGATGLAYLAGKLYMGDFNGGRLRAVDSGTGAAAISWSAGGGHVLGVAAGPDGCLYVTTFDALFQVDIPSTGRCELGPVAAPPTPSPPTSPPTPSPPPPTPTATPEPTPVPPPTPAPPTPAPSATPTSTPPAPPTPSGPRPERPTPTLSATPAPANLPSTTPPSGAAANESTEPAQTPGVGVALLLATAATAAAAWRRR